MISAILLAVLSATPEEIKRYEDRYAAERMDMIASRKRDLEQTRRFWKGVPPAKQKNRGFHTVAGREQLLAEAENPFGMYALGLPVDSLQVGDIGRWEHFPNITIIDELSFRCSFRVKAKLPEGVRRLPDGRLTGRRPDGVVVTRTDGGEDFFPVTLRVEKVDTLGLKDGDTLALKKMYYVSGKSDEGEWIIEPFDPPK